MSLRHCTLAALATFGTTACFGPAGPYATGLTVETEREETNITR